MYVCEICKKVVPSHTKSIRVPVKTREKQYPSRQVQVQRGRKIKTLTVPGGIGYEIVHEAIACPECAAKFNGKSDEV